MAHQKPLIQRFAAPLCALLLMLGVTLIPRVETKPRLKVALSVWPGAETLVLARDLGVLPKDKIHIVELPWASAVSRTFDDGVVDVAVMTLDGVLQLRKTGDNLCVLMVMDQSTGGDALMARADLKRLQDLKGRRVGVDLYGVGMYLLVNALESAGLTLQDIETVPLIQPEIETMFASGRIDAAVASQPWMTRLTEAGMHPLYDSRELKTPILRVLVASKKACEEYKPELLELLRAQVSMMQMIRSRQRFDGIDGVLRRQQVGYEQFVQNLTHWEPLDLDANVKMLEGPAPRIESLAHQIEQQMRRNGQLIATPEHPGWIDSQTIQKAWR
jgi:NitT/TauT family transport system substrate-binding protein